jgi:hypothetical protein
MRHSPIFPNEILNIIFSYREKHPLSIIMNIIIDIHNDNIVYHEMGFNDWIFSIYRYIKNTYGSKKYISINKINYGNEKLINYFIDYCGIFY